MTFDPSGPRRYLTIKVDDPATPSESVDGQPGWKAILTVDGTDRGPIEAIHTKSPGKAAELAVNVLEDARLREYLRDHPDGKS